MPQTEVVVFAQEDGSSPLLRWLDQQSTKVQDKCLVRMERLAEYGHELRRPAADLLRDGIHELRVRVGNVHYRRLYFFHDRRAVLSHGLTKEKAVPDREIELAFKRKSEFERDPETHTYRE